MACKLLRCLCVLHILSMAAWSQKYSTGDRIVLIQDSQLVINGETVVDNMNAGWSTTVNDVNGDWLWVSNGTPGWIDSANVIPLDRKAIDWATQRIKRNPNDAGVFSVRSLIWKDLGEKAIALADINDAIRLKPDSAVNYVCRGHIQSSRGEYELALMTCPH